MSTTGPRKRKIRETSLVEWYKIAPLIIGRCVRSVEAARILLTIHRIRYFYNSQLMDASFARIYCIPLPVPLGPTPLVQLTKPCRLINRFVDTRCPLRVRRDPTRRMFHNPVKILPPRSRWNARKRTSWNYRPSRCRTVSSFRRMTRVNRRRS